MAKERMTSEILKIVGYFVPLIQSLPPLGVWTGLMTLPFAGYVILIFTNLPLSLPKAFHEFFTPFLIIEKTLVVVGFFILFYSMAYLRIKKKEGLVITGPYKIVRHPQYLGMILLTLGFTSWSVWILKNTFGIGFLGPSQTLGVWFIELFAYILLAIIEEQYLSRGYDENFKKYRSKVSLFIPLLKTNRDDLNILISFLIPSILLFGLIGFH